MKDEQYRQGDFMFIKIAKAPQRGTIEKRDNGRVIIGYGEATGHHHSTAKADVKIKSNPSIRWIEAPTGANINHQEHHAVTLPAGIYEIRQERTYHASEIRRVVD